ncbi:MAG: SpoIIIAH-like family protein [Ruminococcaceae bacterium]|nr:SpoIIIAH-like family protein [Oscillospiraceae bacterium]
MKYLSEVICMIKFREIGDKIRQAGKKMGTKTLIAAGAVLVLGCAVALSLILGGGDGSMVDQKNKLAVDLTSDGAGEVLQPNEVKDYFATIALQRDQARDEAMAVLKTVTESETALEEAKQAALTDINKIAADIEREANIETLVMSKGFEQCIAVISDNKCNIIVQTNGLLPGQLAQIAEIVYEQTGIVPENLKIIEKNT